VQCIVTTTRSRASGPLARRRNDRHDHHYPDFLRRGRLPVIICAYLCFHSHSLTAQLSFLHSLLRVINVLITNVKFILLYVGDIVSVDSSLRNLVAPSYRLDMGFARPAGQLSTDTRIACPAVPPGPAVFPGQFKGKLPSFLLKDPTRDSEYRSIHACFQSMTLTAHSVLF